MSFWNPSDIKETALPPCHYAVQFFVEEENNQKYLSCKFNMRSTDCFLGLPFNLFSYTVLTYILAAKCGMKPRKLIYSGGDVHIYNNHISQVKQQLTAKCFSSPVLTLADTIKHKPFKDISIDDFEIVGYYPNNVIKAPMAV